MTIPQLRAALMRPTPSRDDRATLIRQVFQLQNNGLWDDPIPPLNPQPGECGLCGEPPGQCGHPRQ